MASVAKKMQADYEASAQIEHRASKGRSREGLLLDHYLKKYLPPTVAATHGAEVVTSSGEVSSECDIVLFDHATPPLLDSDDFRVLPVECVYAIIEVKSHLDGAQLRDAVHKISKVKSFDKQAFRPGGPHKDHGTFRYGKEWWDFFPTAGYVFAYSGTNLVRLSDQLQELQQDLPEEHCVDSIYVLDQGWITNRRPQGIVARSDHALVAMTIELQTLCQHVWMPRFQISDYFGEAGLGEVVRLFSPGHVLRAPLTVQSPPDSIQDASDTRGGGASEC
jgi:hypothetical protein